MKIIKMLAVIFLLVLVLNGCTSFQLASRSKKVSVENISPTTITVGFCGNAYMDQKEAEKYALQRASIEALSKGYSYFVVVKKEDNSKICALNSVINKKGPSESQAVKDSGYVSSSKFIEPNVLLTIQCVSKGEKIPENAINAQQFLDENFPGIK